MISYLFYELTGLSVINCEKKHASAVEKKKLRMNWNFFACTEVVAVNGVSYQLGSSSLGSACLHALGDREATVLKPGSFLCQRQGSGSFRWNLLLWCWHRNHRTSTSVSPLEKKYLGQQTCHDVNIQKNSDPGNIV